MNVTIGQEVAVFMDGLYDIGYKVVKITQTGQITAQKGNLAAVRFDNGGRQIGGYGRRLITDVQQAKIAYQKQIARATVRRLGWHVGHNASMDDLDKMIADFEVQIKNAKAEISKAKTVEEDYAATSN